MDGSSVDVYELVESVVETLLETDSAAIKKPTTTEQMESVTTMISMGRRCNFGFAVDAPALVAPLLRALSAASIFANPAAPRWPDAFGPLRCKLPPGTCDCPEFDPGCWAKGEAGGCAEPGVCRQLWEGAGG